jgi:hypothetical protein
VIIATMMSRADAGPKQLIATEIIAVLTGNTLVGDWDGIACRQYFGPDGQIIYATLGGRPVNGAWHVNDADQLCERVPPNTNERCYVMLRAGITIFWVTPNSGLRHRAIVVTGKVLDFAIENSN